jgi:hypothetical protein
MIRPTVKAAFDVINTDEPDHENASISLIEFTRWLGPLEDAASAGGSKSLHRQRRDMLLKIEAEERKLASARTELALFATDLEPAGVARMTALSKLRHDFADGLRIRVRKVAEEHARDPKKRPPPWRKTVACGCDNCTTPLCSPRRVKFVQRPQTGESPRRPHSAGEQSPRPPPQPRSPQRPSSASIRRPVAVLAAGGLRPRPHSAR